MFAVHVRWYNVLVLAFCSLFLLTSGCVSTQKGATGSAEIDGSALTIKGKVQNISPEEGLMVVAPPKGDRVTLKFTPQTPVKGGSIKEITKFQPVRVIYAVEGEENSAVSIEILPQGSCN
jgi:hypothetical protein